MSLKKNSATAIFLLDTDNLLQYKKPHTDEDDPHDAIRNKLKRYNLLLSYCNPGGASYEKIKQEKEDARQLKEHWGEIASAKELQLTDEDIQTLKDFMKDL